LKQFPSGGILGYPLNPFNQLALAPELIDNPALKRKGCQGPSPEDFAAEGSATSTPKSEKIQETNSPMSGIISSALPGPNFTAAKILLWLRFLFDHIHWFQSFGPVPNTHVTSFWVPVSGKSTTTLLVETIPDGARCCLLRTT